MSTALEAERSLLPRPLRTGSVQRRCACGGVPGSAHAPPLVHEVLGEPGTALDNRTRRSLERRFGQDFSRVRVHADARAADSARAVGAAAYTVGSHVVFDAGQFAPATASGRRLLAHELTHIVQQLEAGDLPAAIGPTDDRAEREAERTAALVSETRNADGTQALPRILRSGSRPRLARQPTDPTERARYPTASDREAAMGLLDPQREAARTGGGTVPPVADPGGFRTEMTRVLNEYIGAVVALARERESSPVSLDRPEVHSLGVVAHRELERVYRPYLRAAVHSPDEAARLAAFDPRSELRLVSDRASDSDVVACNWVASRMFDQGGAVIEAFHVLASVDAAKDHCFTPGASGARDQALFEEVRNSIVDARRADLRTIVVFAASFRSPAGAFIQSRLAPREGEPQERTRRRGRWETFGTIVHELLHALAHEDFREAAERIEETNIAVEGFAEHFTSPVYEDVRRRVATEAPLRSSIEGVVAPFDASLTEERRGYRRYAEQVVELRRVLGGNEENLRVAYFMGRVEFLGLGGWNAQEAERRHALGQPANVLGAAALLVDQYGFFRVDYGRVVAGRGGNLRFELGGTINYLTQGDRLGLGGAASIEYRWPAVYLRGGVAAAGSASLGQPLETTVRLDLIPGAEFGARIGVMRVGATANVLFPIVGGPVDQRVLRLAAGVGISGEF